MFDLLIRKVRGQSVTTASDNTTTLISLGSSNRKYFAYSAPAMPSNMPPPTPRKFQEKIALHMQRKAEGEAEFDKIMAECQAVTGTQRVS